MLHFWADGGIWGNGIRDVYAATMVSPLGMRTHFLSYRTGNFSLHGQVVGSKLPVHPE